MSTQSASPINGPVTAQNAGTTDIPTLMANATRTFAALPPAIMELGTIFDEAGRNSRSSVDRCAMLSWV